MRVEFNVPESLTGPRIWGRHPPQHDGAHVHRAGHTDVFLTMALRAGSIEIGSRASALRRIPYSPYEVGLCPPYAEQWVGAADFERLNLGISDAVLRAASDTTTGDVELRKPSKVEDARLRAMTEAVNAERIAGFSSGRLFLDSMEQAIAAALIDRYAVRHRPLQTHRGGLGAARLRRIKELVAASMEDELTLAEMAQSVELSTAHFARMFRKSTGETPHRFVLRQRVEHAKEMLRSAHLRIIDVAAACGFKTQEHFAQVFRQISGVSPTEYRRNC